LFVFQAEDGIRYRNVTGVQTCALPILISHLDHIFHRQSDSRQHFLDVLKRPSAFAFERILHDGPVFIDGSLTRDEYQFSYLQGRSEERRVGKERKSGLSTHTVTIKTVK